MASTWKKIEESKIYFDNNGDMYLNFNRDGSAVKNFSKHYEKNLAKTDAIMNEIVEEISKRVGFNVKYRRIDGKGPQNCNNARYTINTEDLFPNQEDWELLQILADAEILSIKFPETNKNWNDYNYIPDNEASTPSRCFKDGKLTEPSKEKYLVIPEIDLSKFTIRDPSELSFDELEDPNLPENDPEDNAICIDKPIGQIGEHGVVYDECGDSDYVQPFYPFEFDSCFMNSKEVKIKKWKEKVIETIVEDYNICKNILEMTKPFALEMKHQILLKRKSLQNLKNKLRIALE